MGCDDRHRGARNATSLPFACEFESRRDAMPGVVVGGQSRRAIVRLAPLLSLSLLLASMMSVGAEPADEDRDRTPRRGQLSRVKHIIVVMQENHSFDNYLGALPYAAGSPYRSGPCKANDHSCVDSLSCSRHPTTGAYHCRDAN